MLTINPAKITGWSPYYINALNYDTGNMYPIIRLGYVPDEPFYLINEKDKIMFMGQVGDAVIWRVDPDEIHKKSSDTYPYYPCIKNVFHQKYTDLNKIKQPNIKLIMVEKWKKVLKEHTELL